MNIYKYEFEYKVYNSSGLEVDKGVETSKGYDEVRAENYLRTRLEEGCQSDEEVELKLIPSFVKYTDANKLIAEFMGWDADHNDSSIMVFKATKGNQIIPMGELKYHTSWDWLIPVVREILTRIDIDSIEYETHNLEYETLDADIKGAYKQVVEFIEWYNNNQNT
jgi:hypothetical protein